MKLIFYFILLCLNAPVWADIEITDAWIREASPSAKMHAGYFSIKNTGGEEVKLESVSSEVYGRVMMHQTITLENGLTSMKHLDFVVVPAGQSVEFKPGDMHLMLMGPKQVLNRGTEIEVVFTFESKNSVTHPFIVEKR